MQISSDIKKIVSKGFDGLLPTREEIVCLLRINHQSIDAGFIMAAANAISREAAEGQAEVHAQIGLNLAPCPKDCSFCSFAAFNGVFKERNELSVEEVVRLSLKAEAAGANLFWAEAGANPRDTEAETSKGRGLDVKTCIRIFQEADWDILQGPSVIYSASNKKLIYSPGG